MTAKDKETKVLKTLLHDASMDIISETMFNQNVVVADTALSALADALKFRVRPDPSTSVSVVANEVYFSAGALNDEEFDKMVSWVKRTRKRTSAVSNEHIVFIINALNVLIKFPEGDSRCRSILIDLPKIKDRLKSDHPVKCLVGLFTYTTTVGKTIGGITAALSHNGNTLSMGDLSQMTDTKKLSDQLTFKGVDGLRRALATAVTNALSENMLAELVNKKEQKDG